MAIDIAPVILLPTLDAERFVRCSFSLQDNLSLLTITLEDLPPFLVHFHKLRWHRFTPAAQCNAGLIQGCDFAVAEVRNSPALAHYVTKESVPVRDAAALHHYRLYLGPGGCHEAFAQSAFSSGDSKMSRRFATFIDGVRRKTGLRAS
jgi:hypothetical protein